VDNFKANFEEQLQLEPPKYRKFSEMIIWRTPLLKM